MAFAIRVEHLGKNYRLAGGASRPGYRTLRESLSGGAASLAGWVRGRVTREPTEEFWALKDVSFEVEPGEVIGVIGRNGAGKSTLLKVLSRITKPATGRVVIDGRVGSLLEVGTGFHPELTGRENVYLNGSILGMSRREINRKFDEIVAFSEVERFLDTPVKRYSSGMYVRLAFAVAAHLEPEILIVDEVLAVGDAGFQQKCLGKMQQVGRSGRTVVFVSHNLNAVALLTGRSVLLQRGKLIGYGPTPEIIRQYIDKGSDSVADWVRPADRPAGPAVIRAIRSVGPVDAQLAFRFNADQDCETIFTSSLTDADGLPSRVFSAGTFRARCAIPRHFLRPGSYHVLAALNNPNGKQFDLVERALSIEVSEIGSLARFDNRLGSVVPLMPWTVDAA